jgi:hypothetical protein
VRRAKPKNYKKRNIQSYIEEKTRQTNWEINRKIAVEFRQKKPAQSTLETRKKKLH